MKTYVEVPAEKLINFLSSKGFIKYDNSKFGNEVVYAFAHLKNKNVLVKVYTSIKDGSDVARGCGKDAIRVCTVYENAVTDKSFPLGKFNRVYRVGTVEGVLERLHERCRAAYVRGTEWINSPKPWDKEKNEKV